MRSSNRDKKLDRLISHAAAKDKNWPVPHFDKWMQDHPEAVQKLKTQVERVASKDCSYQMGSLRKPLFVRFPRLIWIGGIAALFLIATSCTTSIVLVEKNRILMKELQLARQEIAVDNRQQQIADAQNGQQQAISDLHVRVKELERRVQRGISPRMIWYSESPYYEPEWPDKL